MARKKKSRRRRLGTAEPDPMIRAFKVCQRKFANNRSGLYGCEAGVEFLADEQKKS
jgi:hypothetical protein